MTEQLYRADPYLSDCRARVLAVTERGGIILDRTVFYAAAGGQPGDTGVFQVEGAQPCPIATTVYDGDKTTIVHVADPKGPLPVAGQSVRAVLDWGRRHDLMRMHTCLHLLCALVKFPVTGGQIGAEESRLDFDIESAAAVDREALSAGLNALIRADHKVGERWISDAELDANPQLVRTLSVKPPRGAGKIRLVSIGEEGGIDLQPCGGTHVRSTAEIGPVAVSKIEKKGRLNRRIRVVFAQEPPLHQQSGT
jgi:misacylated tRNA(Ala) deacylase